MKERHLKAPIVLAGATVLLALLFLFVPRDARTSTFRLSDQSSALALPDVALPTASTFWVVIGILVVLTVGAFLRAWTYRAPSLWLVIAFSVLAVFAFLVWAAAGETRARHEPAVRCGLALGAPGLRSSRRRHRRACRRRERRDRGAAAPWARSPRRSCRASRATRSSVSSAP